MKIFAAQTSGNPDDESWSITVQISLTLTVSCLFIHVLRMIRMQKRCEVIRAEVSSDYLIYAALAPVPFWAQTASRMPAQRQVPRCDLHVI